MQAKPSKVSQRFTVSAGAEDSDSALGYTLRFVA